MKPLNIKPALSPAANGLSAMVVNTQCRTGVGIVRREVQSSAAWYPGQTVEMNLTLQPLQTYTVVDSTSAFVLSCNNDLEFKHKPNNTHDHTLVVSQQFSADYLITGIGLKNPSTTEVVEATITYVPFTGTLPAEQPCGGGALPVFTGTLIDAMAAGNGEGTAPITNDTYSGFGRDFYHFLIKLRVPYNGVEPPSPPNLRFLLPDGDNPHESKILQFTPPLAHIEYIGDDILYLYEPALAIPPDLGDSQYGVVMIDAVTTGDYILNVTPRYSDNLQRREALD